MTKSFEFNPTEHADLMRAITEDFAPRFAPGSELIFVGEMKQQPQYFDDASLASLCVTVDAHGKMPDVVLYFEKTQVAAARRVRHQSRARQCKAPCGAAQIVRGFIGWHRFRDGVSKSCGHGALSERNCLGNRGLGG